MRKVDRKAVSIPKILTTEKAQQAYNDLMSLISLNDSLLNRRIPIEYEIVRNPEVFRSLRELFKNKCAYCEISIHEDALDHFRPIRAASDYKEITSSLLHYSWLAYEWRNLYLSCRACNASKRNRFPVKGRRAPPLFSLDEVREREDAQLIDPCLDRPDRAFDFTFEGECISRSPKGNQSIHIFDLNREDLIFRRRNIFSSAINASLLQPINSETDLFAADKPHVGALEIFARRMCDVFAKHLGLPPPPYNAQLREFPRLLRTINPNDLQNLLDSKRESSRSIQIQDNYFKPTFYLPPPVHRGRLKRSISHIRIENFKGINHLDLDLQELASDARSAACVMFLADNAAGKTSLLQAIALATMGPDRASELKFDRNSLIRNSDPNHWGHSKKLTPHVRIDFHSGETSEIALDPFSLEFSGFSELADSLTAYGAHRLLGSRKRRGRVTTARVASLFDRRAEVSHPEEWLAQESIPFEAVARALSEVLVLQSQDKLVRNFEGNVFVQTYGQTTPIDALSDGYVSVIAMVVDTLRWLLDDWPDLETARGIVLIDELDAHLHPRWKLQIMGALRAAMPQVQFIVTTHDPLCLRGMERGEVKVIKRSFEQHFDLITDLPDFTAMSAEQLLMSDYFGLNTTSDPSVDLNLGHIADTFTHGKKDSKELHTELDALMMGDTPERQIADEALLKYLRERRSSSGQKVSESRRTAIEAALNAIRANSSSND